MCNNIPLIRHCEVHSIDKLKVTLLCFISTICMQLLIQYTFPCFCKQNLLKIMKSFQGCHVCF